MANRLLYQYSSDYEKGVVTLAGVISINSSAAVTSTTMKSSSAANSGTGLFTITLTDAFVSLLSCNVTLFAATAVDLVPQIVSVDVVTAKTIVIRLCAAAVATDPSAACQLHVSLRLKNSSV